MNPADRLVVGLNGAALLSPLTGIGQYTKSLAEHLIASGEVDLNIFYLAAWSREIRTQPLRSVTPIKSFIKKVVPHAYLITRALQGRVFHAGAQRRRVSVYHEPNFLPHAFSGPTVITAHDLSWIRFPETHPPKRVEIMNRLFPPSLARADHVITDARFTRDEIIQEFGVPGDRITSIPLAARSIFRPRSGPECSATLAANSLSYRSFILCVGTLEPRKNLEFVIRSYAQMPDAFRSQWPLVIVGMKGWLTSSLESLMQPMVTSGQVRPLGFTSETDLAALYASARMLVYPSLYEGFGLPPLEAMASGTPVIVSDRSTLPEVVGDAGMLVDPSDEPALRQAMERLTGDSETWNRLSVASLTQASKFSWSRCAAETLAVYRKVLAQA